METTNSSLYGFPCLLDKRAFSIELTQPLSIHHDQKDELKNKTHKSE